MDFDLIFEQGIGNKTSMNQNISISQIKQLNVLELNKLIISLGMTKYWREAKMRTLVYEENVLKEIMDYCTIGKMIELLSDSEFCFPTIGLTESSKIHEYIVVGVTCLSGSKKYRGKTFEGDDLVDALWNTVKSILSES